jgi:hypothetical protein
MNLASSDLPRLAGATSLSKPGFDIILAISSARQATLPTVRLLHDQANRDSRRTKLNALRDLLVGSTNGAIPRPVRFFDLSDSANALPQSMNSLFTRGFQPMLNPSHIEAWSSAPPIPLDEDNME